MNNICCYLKHRNNEFFKISFTTRMLLLIDYFCAEKQLQKKQPI